MKCPSCDHFVPDNTEFCAYCGFGFKREGPTRAPTARCGQRLNSVQELAEHFYDHWDEGRFHLYRGDLAIWLRDVFHRTDLEQVALDVVKHEADEDVGLQELLDQCGAYGPALEVAGPGMRNGVWDLGQVDKGGVISVTLEISNRTRGHLYGQVVSRERWLRVANNGEFACSSKSRRTRVTLELDTQGTHEISNPIPVLEVRSNDRTQLNLPISLRVLFNPRLAVTWSSNGATGQPPIDFGEVAKAGQRRVTRTVLLTNVGGGVLQATVRPAAWLSVQSGLFLSGPLAEGASSAFDLVADIGQMDIRRSQEIAFTISTNVGDALVPARIGVRKWWYALAWGLLLYLLYGTFCLAFISLVAGLVTHLWWYGSLLLPRMESVDREYLVWIGLMVGSIGVSGACVYLLRPLVEELEGYHFEDKFRNRLPDAVHDRSRVVVATLVLTLLGLLVGGVALGLESQTPTPLPIGLPLASGAAIVLGVLTTTRAYRVMRFLPFRILRVPLLVLSASAFYATVGFVIASPDARYLAGWWSGTLGAMWALCVLGSESALFPPAVRVRLRQFSQAWLAITLGLIGFYGIDIFRSLSHPENWNIPTQVHFPSDVEGVVPIYFSVLKTDALALLSSVLAFVGLVMGLSAGGLADSSTETHALRVLWFNALRSLPVDGHISPQRMYTQEVQEWIQAFTHWPKTLERNWASTLAIVIAFLLAVYVAIVGGISFVLIPVILAAGIIGGIIYVIIQVIIFIVNLILQIIVVIIVIWFILAWLAGGGR